MIHISKIEEIQFVKNFNIFEIILLVFQPKLISSYFILNGLIFLWNEILDHSVYQFGDKF